MQEIRESVEHRDAHRLERAAHRLKGSLIPFMATTASTALAELEAIGRSQNLTNADQEFRQLEQRMDDLLHDLEQRLKEAL
jgi:HPt (histidine-containing phosphotransfer) domain-containing protein